MGFKKKNVFDLPLLHRPVDIQIQGIIFFSFSVIHVIGHGINLYHISTQTSGDANCYFMEYFRA